MLIPSYRLVILRGIRNFYIALKSAEISALLASLMSVSQWIYIYYLYRPNLEDEVDNHLIELAVAGNAQIIPTHNIKDF